MKVNRRKLRKMILEALGDRGDLPRRPKGPSFEYDGPEDLPWGNVTGNNPKHQSQREPYDPDSGGDPSMSDVYGDPNEKLRGSTIEYPHGRKAFLQSMIDTYRKVGMHEEADRAQAELDAMGDDVFKSTLE